MAYAAALTPYLVLLDDVGLMAELARACGEL